MRKKVELKIKWFLVDFLCFFGWRPKMNLKSGAVKALLFHGVCLDNEPLINGRFIHLSRLDKLLQALSAHFHLISLEDYKTNRISMSKPSIVCTFDDGYKNNLELALPLFDKYNIPFAIFCNNVPHHLMDLLDIANYWQPTLIETFKKQFDLLKSLPHIKAHCKVQNAEVVSEMRNYLWKNLSPDVKEKSKRYWELLSDAEISSLSKNKLVSFGNHGADHLSYTCLTEKQMLADVKAVDKRFKQMAVKLKGFAYPYSESSYRTISLVNKVGYDLQFSELTTNETTLIAKNRLTINPFISATNQLIAISKDQY
ncbi:MAG: hypothetical protein COA32_00630 [Fluviicola sp.]|nr:MAG: hypothetical protein COA32_00630 [Fluviicola sp.]